MSIFPGSSKQDSKNNPHSLTAFESHFFEDGEVAVCCCGWKSKGCSTVSEASAEHYKHQAEITSTH